MTFDIDEHGAIVSAPATGRLVEASLFPLWKRADKLSSVIASTIPHDRQRGLLHELAAILNAAATGATDGDYQVTELEKKIIAEARAHRWRLIFTHIGEVVGILALAGLALIFYAGLRLAEYVSGGASDPYGFPPGAAGRNIVQNLIGAFGFIAIGFALGAALRHLYHLFADEPAAVARRIASPPGPELAVLYTVFVIVLALTSVWLQVAGFEIVKAGYEIIQKPHWSIPVGFLLGLSAPKVIRSLIA